MPNVGTPPASVRPTSHTSSEQWQSFEVKMRHRRAERCLIRAEAALEAGNDAEARSALAEARALNPQSLDFDTLKARIEERHAASADALRRRKRLKLVLGAAAALVLAVGGVGFLAGGRASSPDPFPGDRPHKPVALPASAPVAASSTKGLNDPAERIVSTEGKVPPPVSLPNVGTVPDETPSPLATERSSSSPPVSEPPPLPPVGQVEPEVTIPRVSTSDAARSLPPATAVDPVGSGLPSTAAPEPAPPPPVAAPPPRPVETVEERPEIANERKVRAVLAEFEAAYSSLNAAAAQAVWPSVDTRSLARAFASLESQRVSLGACSVRVTGAVARADCNGTTSWKPKIGGGGRTEPTRWSFDLQAADGAWRIVQALAR